MLGVSELLREEAKENQTRKILRLLEKDEKEGKTPKELVKIVEDQLKK